MIILFDGRVYVFFSSDPRIFVGNLNNIIYSRLIHDWINIHTHTHVNRVLFTGRKNWPNFVRYPRIKRFVPPTEFNIVVYFFFFMGLRRVLRLLADVISCTDIIYINILSRDKLAVFTPRSDWLYFDNITFC